MVLTTLAEIARHPLIREKYGLLAEAARLAEAKLGDHDRIDLKLQDPIALPCAPPPASVPPEPVRYRLTYAKLIASGMNPATT